MEAQVLPAMTARVIATKPKLIEDVISESSVAKGGILSLLITPNHERSICLRLRCRSWTK